MQIFEKKLTEIKPYERNPRNNTAAVDKVAASIREFGFKVPIVIDRDGVIVAGHTRFKAAGNLGMETVPCIVADDLTEEQIKAFRLADNKTAEFASWIIEDLAAELQGIQEINMAAFGFDQNEPESAEDVEEDDSFTDADVTAHGIERGQIWRLGDHRLICGDASSKEDADRLMEDDPAVFVFTDPPYGVAIGDKNKFLNEFGRGGYARQTSRATRWMSTHSGIC